METTNPLNLKQPGAVEALCEAMVEACPSEDELRLAVLAFLDEDLYMIVRGRSLNELVANLVTWAEAQGRIDNLFAVVTNLKPDGVKLREFVEKFCATDGDKAAPVAPAKQEGYVTLTDGTIHAEALVTMAYGALEWLMKRDRDSIMAVYELRENCRDPNHELSEGDVRFLNKSGLMDHTGYILPSIRHAILCAVQGEMPEMHLVSPIAPAKQG